MGCGSSQVDQSGSVEQKPATKPVQNGAIKETAVTGGKRVSSTDSNANRADQVTNNPGKIL